MDSFVKSLLADARKELEEKKEVVPAEKPPKVVGARWYKVHWYVQFECPAKDIYDVEDFGLSVVKKIKDSRIVGGSCELASDIHCHGIKQDRGEGTVRGIEKVHKLNEGVYCYDLRERFKELFKGAEGISIGWFSSTRCCKDD
jgi:hypothetical protein